MTFLENVYHDFPRLARQSGFHFQLHSGKVNWTEIENLDLNDIIENENYKLLEQNLANVINCNLEKEYDVKVLDENFVKLFKLAQLGVDYLSYFEIYLDKCVTLLQEELIAYKEEFDSFKHKDLNKSKKKNKVQSFQCEKCEKVFISDVYLKFHDKRRHSRPNSLEKLHNNCQENEEKKQISISTQTLFLDGVSTSTQDYGNTNSLFKIGKLEQELQELKEHLQKTETVTKTEDFKEFESSFNGSDKKQYSSILLFFPFYLPQSTNDTTNHKTSSEHQKSIQEVAQPYCSIMPSDKSESPTNETQLKNFSPLNFELENKFDEENEAAKEQIKLGNTSVNLESFRQILREEIRTLRFEKDNASTNNKTDVFTNVTKPLPPPRKLRKGFQKHLIKGKMMGLYETTKEDLNLKNQNEDFSNLLIKGKSTYIAEANEENILNVSENSKKSFTEINKSESNLNSIDCLQNDTSVAAEPQFKFFMKKIVTRSSPKLGKLGENFEKSLNPCSAIDFGSTLGKKESDYLNLKAAVIDEVNNHLKQLGVDPEWTGLPKKTMKQKSNVLKHRKRLLSKVNPTYCTVRRNIEEKIIQKLKTRLKKKKTIFCKQINNQSSMNKKSHLTHNTLGEGLTGLIKVKSSIINNIGTDLDSTESSSEKNLSVIQKTVIIKEKENSCEPTKNVEFDFSVFQVGKNSNITIDDKKEKSSNKISDHDSNLEHESDLSDNFNGKSYKTLTSPLNSTIMGEDNHQQKNDNLLKQHFKFSPTEKRSAENQRIFTNGEIQSKPTINPKEKDFLKSYPSLIEELSDGSTDDFWPLNSVS